MNNDSYETHHVHVHVRSPPVGSRTRISCYTMKWVTSSFKLIWNTNIHELTWFDTFLSFLHMQPMRLGKWAEWTDESWDTVSSSLWSLHYGGSPIDVSSFKKRRKKETQVTGLKWHDGEWMMTEWLFLDEYLLLHVVYAQRAMSRVTQVKTHQDELVSVSHVCLVYIWF